MQTLKNYLKNFKLQGCIDDILAIKELHFVKDQYFKNIITAVKSMQKNKNSDLKKTLSQFFHKHQFNQKQTLRLLMIVHEVLRQTECYETTDCIIEVLFDFCEQLREIQESKLKNIDGYLKRSFTVPYTTYLIKAYRKQSQKEFVKEKQRKKRLFLGIQEKKGKVPNKNSKQLLQGIEMDFTIFNLVTDIIKFNSDLNQMGRYYLNHQYTINFYLEMLKDFDIYFKIIQDSFVKMTHLNKDQVNSEQTQKVYLFMSESERCVSKMNSFYYNKYLFYYVNDKINLKMQLEIPQTFYKVFKKFHRGNQKKLSFDYCLTATLTGNQMHQTETRDTNRSKSNNLSKIMLSISSLNETLEQIENIQKIQLEKENYQQNLRKSAMF